MTPSLLHTARVLGTWVCIAVSFLALFQASIAGSDWLVRRHLRRRR